MENNNIKDLWRASDENASSYYRKIEHSLLEKAKKKSEDIFSRISRKTYTELWISVLIALAFPWLFLYNMEAFVGIYVFMMIALGITIWFYLGFLKKINNIQEHDVFTALLQKEIVLSRYVKWQHIFTAIALLTGGFFGLFINMDEEINLQKTGIMIAIMLPILLLLYLLLRRYIHAMYGKHLKELRQVINGLKEQNDD